MKDDDGMVKFEISVEMPERWVPHFRGMLEYMQQLGNVGASREITFMSDGDGDFRPKFSFSKEIASAADPIEDHDGNRYYDAG